MQTPPVHCSVLSQACPHAPQLLGSLDTSPQLAPAAPALDVPPLPLDAPTPPVDVPAAPPVDVPALPAGAPAAAPRPNNSGLSTDVPHP
jgi:hypothetical protein